VLAAEKLVSLGVTYAVVTLGENGAVAATKNGCFKSPAFPCRPVDTTGAGDAFWGAFLFRLKTLQHTLFEIEEYVKFANAAASLCVEGRGGIPSMPEVEAVHMRLALNLLVSIINYQYTAFNSAQCAP
jgi:fructokinase